MSSLDANAAAADEGGDADADADAAKLELESSLREDAALWGKLELVKSILADPLGVDVNSCTRSLNTALHYAAQGAISSTDNGLPAEDNVIQALLEAGGDIHLKNAEGKTALELARAFKHPGAVST